MNAKLDFDVLVIGNVGIDTNVYLPENQLNLEVEGHFAETRDYVGQSGGFSARGFAQLGYRTAFLGFVGDDLPGNYVLSEFTSDGINLEGTFRDPAGTNRSVNLVFPDGTRRSFFDGKGHLRQKPDLDICLGLLKRTRLAHFSIPDWARHLLPLARELDLVVSCDLQDIPEPGDPYRQDFIHHADILFFSSANLESPEILNREVLKAYPEKILLSGLGSKGCALATREGTEYYSAIELDQPVVDTNGAGDSLAVGFLAGYILEEQDPAAAVRQGLIAARHACSCKADSSHLLSRTDLARYLKHIAAGS